MWVGELRFMKFSGNQADDVLPSLKPGFQGLSGHQPLVRRWERDRTEDDDVRGLYGPGFNM